MNPDLPFQQPHFRLEILENPHHESGAGGFDRPGRGLDYKAFIQGGAQAGDQHSLSQLEPPGSGAGMRQNRPAVVQKDCGDVIGHPHGNRARLARPGLGVFRQRQAAGDLHRALGIRRHVCDGRVERRFYRIGFDRIRGLGVGGNRNCLGPENQKQQRRSDGGGRGDQPAAGLAPRRGSLVNPIMIELGQRLGGGLLEHSAHLAVFLQGHLAFRAAGKVVFEFGSLGGRKEIVEVGLDAI